MTFMEKITNVYMTLEFCWHLFLTILQWICATSVISKWDKFSPFSFLVKLVLVIPTNFIVSGIKS